MSERLTGDPGSNDPPSLNLTRSPVEQPALVVIDLDDPRSTALERLPVAFAGVVVGLSRTASTGSRPDVSAGVDFVLVPGEVTRVGPRHHAVWVAAADIDAELSRVDDALKRSPIAAVTLMQVLRAGFAASLERDLLVESLAYSALQAGVEHLSWLGGRPTRRDHGEQIGPPVMLERDGGMLTITLNRPQVRNAFDVGVRDGLQEALELVALDPSIEHAKVVGAGSDFCSGGDLDEFGTGPGPTASHLIRTTCSPALWLSRVASRVTVEIHGACVGAGIEIAALAGRVVATTDAKVRLPEVGMGLIPGAGGTASLPRRIGRHRTAWLALSGGWLDAATAFAWGLVDEVREPDLEPSALVR
jgi:enoyl-CoA hydratase/carnithine racemase